MQVWQSIGGCRHSENRMETQSTATSGWTILADFGETLGVAIAAGMFFSVLAGLLVFVVSTVN